MHEGSSPGHAPRIPLLPVRALWKMGLSVFRATRLADLRVGRFSMKGVHRQVVRHFVWPYYARLARGEVCVRGLRMFLPQDPDSLGYLMGTFEQHTCELFDRLIEEGMTVVDAGANIGFYSLLAARKVGPTGRVFAFEPEPANFALLGKNVEINGYRNIQTFPEALTTKKGRVALYISREGSGSHSIYRDNAVSSENIEVESISFDDFWEAEGRPSIGFIKMDIEGAEAAALEGMQRFLNATPSLTMISEFFPGALRAAGTEPESYLRRLAALGFQVQALLGEKSMPLARVDMRSLYRRLGEEFGINLLCTKSPAN
jgi:FkbM family methyltransferase